ncbi:MAG: sarcosine oxidase subunit gamma family protein [Anderseniella sp.]|jgi:sarcosine oxidase subunit gamma|nr:sarcosine oxidase subunit gamma family protein [Anderseniella sp.]
MSDPVFNSALAHVAGHDGATGLSIAMREVSDRGMIDLRGEASSAKFTQAAKSALGLDLPVKPRTSAVKGGITVFWLSVDQWLITCPRGGQHKLLADLTKALDGVHSLAVDVSDMRAIIRLEGEHVREVLMKGSSIDFTLAEYKAGLVRRLVFAEIAALAHIVSEGPDTVDLYVFRSYADYTWKWLKATAGPGAVIGLFSKTG